MATKQDLSTGSDSLSCRSEDEMDRLNQKLGEFKAQLQETKYMELPQYKKKRSNTLLFLTSFLLIWLLVSFSFQKLYIQFEELDLYDGRPELVFMHSMSRWKKHLLLALPFVNDFVKTLLRQHMESHVSIQERYDPEKHNRPYRHLVTNVLTRNECARIRSLVQRQRSFKPFRAQNGVEEEINSLQLEFKEISLYQLLGVDDYEGFDVKPEEKELLYNVLERVQTIAEEKFNSPSMFLEYSGLAVRRNPMQDYKSKWHPKRIHYRTTGGHGMHADQCGHEISPNTYKNRFECKFSKRNCCVQRTHSILLYLNDPDDTNDKLVGGDLYMVDRSDLLDETKPSFSGLGFAKLLQRTVRVEPTCGNLVLFASDTRNFHGTYTNESGARMAMTMWFTSPPDLPRQEPHILQDDDWHAVTETTCGAFNDGMIPMPSGLKQYKGDCYAIIQAIKEEAGFHP